MTIYFVNDKIILEAAQLQNRWILLFIHTVSTVPVHHMCSGAIKHKLMWYITCVLLLFTGNHAHPKIAYNIACTYQIFKFYMR